MRHEEKVFMVPMLDLTAPSQAVEKLGGGKETGAGAAPGWVGREPPQFRKEDHLLQCG